MTRRALLRLAPKALGASLAAMLLTACKKKSGGPSQGNQDGGY